MTLNFDTICRTCMSRSQALMCIFDEQNSSPNDVVSMLTSITSIQAFRNDGLPENVCIGCLSEINRAFSFKNRSERSENTLRQYLNRLNSKSSAENESKMSTNSELAGTTEFEIIEVDEEEQSVSHTEPTDNLKNEIENDGISTNVLDGGKVFVLTPKEDLPNPMNVVYECHVCYDTFDSISSSEQHMTESHDSKNESKDEDDTSERIACPVCSLSVDDASNLDRHIRDNHSNDDEEFHYDPEEVVEVDEATITIQDERDAEDVVQEIVTDEVTINDEIVPVILVNTTESTESELKFNCQKCGGKFAKERSLNIHIKLNKCTVKSFECKVCRKVFVRKKNLDCHMKTHGEQSDFSCKVCSEKFMQADKLAIHIQTQHEPSRKYLCPYCWKGFNVSSSLKDHIRIHNGERPYLCSICGKGFSQSTNLNQHVMRHNKTKPYSCTTCSYSFVSKGELDAHSRKHSGAHPFVCEVCRASFTTSSSLVKHTRIHTGERPYACQYCPMRFAALGTLKNHTRTHNGARPFACGICGRTFSQRSDCLSHQDTHSIDKSFFCKQCYKSFHKKSGLRNHMKIHRNDCSEPSISASNVVTIDNDSMKLTYVTEIYSTSDN